MNKKISELLLKLESWRLDKTIKSFDRRIENLEEIRYKTQKKKEEIDNILIFLHSRED